MTQGRSGRFVPAPLWERDAELAEAAATVDALHSGATSGSLLVYSGEAGIGKTALLTEIGRIAEGRCTVWSARGGETVTSVPFNVLRQLLQPALVALTEEEAREYLGDWYDIAAQGPPSASPSRRAVRPTRRAC
jgi:hypothetical protein